MTFPERYRRADTWHKKALFMSLYHMGQQLENPGWTVANTAKVFGVSIGLVSENLRLANSIDTNPNLINCATRQEALQKLERRKLRYDRP